MFAFRRGSWLLKPTIASAIFVALMGASPLFAQYGSATGSALAAGAPAGVSSGFGFGSNLMQMQDYSQGDYAVGGKVLDLRGNMIRGALVQVSPFPPGSGQYRVFKTDSSGDFQTTYQLSREYANDFMAWITIRKRGYKIAHVLIDTAAYPKPVRLPMTLLPDEQTSGVLSQQDLISSLLPSLKSLGPSDGLSAKSVKDYSKGVQALTGKRDLEASLMDLLNVAKRNPSCAKCRTMLALAELEAGDWNGAARDADSASQWTEKHKTSGSPEAMVLGGVMESWLHDPQQEVNYMVLADKLEPNNPLVLQEIGRAELDLQHFDIADAYLSKALAAGAGPDVRLMRVRALLGEREPDKAKQDMAVYLNGRNVEKMPVEVRRVWLEIQNQEKIKALYAHTQKVEAEKQAAALLKGLVPAKNQDELKPILAAVGKNVSQLFHSFQNSVSVEEVHQEKLGHNGKVSSSVNSKFRYLCLMPSDPSIPGFTEYRQNVDSGQATLSGLDEGYMLTSGFASAALIFDPAFQSGSNFRYLGRQKLDGQEAYVIAFEQKPLKTKLMGGFNVAGKDVPTFEKGLAWIDAHNDQILRLRTELLKPLPEVRLTKETTQINYHDVEFKKLDRDFWLPEEVTVTIDWDGKELRNIHRYSNFEAFNVSEHQKIAAPKKPKSPTS